MSMVNPVIFFYFFEALDDDYVFEVQFFQVFIFFFYTLSKTLIAYRAMQLRFFKVETLLTMLLRTFSDLNTLGILLHAIYW